MDACRRLRPALFRVAEGEAGPDESMEVARHLTECTCCRIVLARERRLAEMLAHLDDAVHVDETFLRSVMDALPEGPPPSLGGEARRRRKRRRGLGIAGLVTAVTAGGLAAARLTALGSAIRLLLPVSHATNLEEMSGLAGGLPHLARWGLLVADGIAGVWSATAPSVEGLIHLSLLLPLAAVTVLASAAVGLAAYVSLSRG